MANGRSRPSNSHRRADLVQQRNDMLADFSVLPRKICVASQKSSSFRTRFQDIPALPANRDITKRCASKCATGSLSDHQHTSFVLDYR
jgi:hypothetical protein